VKSAARLPSPNDDSARRSTGDAGAGAPRLSLTGLRKAFGPTVALAGVDLSARAGEVHALIGENGAGKSTLIRVLAGALSPDEGTITLDGAPYRPSSPAAARASGVAIVHQELSLCPQLTVAANVLLGAEPARYGLLREAEEEARAAALLAELGPAGRALPPRALVADLPPPARQLVEIARALALPRMRLLLLDEPTSSLAAHDVDRLIELTRSLAGRGVAVLYVSHFLEEVRRVADRYTVLRDGRTVGSGAMADADTNELVARMAGRRIEALYPRSPREPGEVLLEVRGLAGARRPKDASFTLRRGEVLGIAGLMGAGRTELVRAIFGLDPVVRGTVRVRAFVGPASPSRRLAQGVGMLSEDRKSEGLAAALSVADNMTLSRLDGLGPLGLVFPTRQRAAAAELIHRLGVRCSGPDQVVSDLSGGNQQKVALARLLHHDVDVLLLDEPTRGIDVASKSQIYQLVDEQAARGKAVLLVSSYLPELLGVCDRIAVMRRGVLGGARPASELTEHDLLMEATGG
jgi:ribose transport system ATP-binding protein